MNSDDARTRFPAAATRLMFVAPELRDRLRAQLAPEPAAGADTAIDPPPAATARSSALPPPLPRKTAAPSADAAIEPPPAAAERSSALSSPLPRKAGATHLAQTRLWPVEKVLAGLVPGTGAPARERVMAGSTDVLWLRRFARRFQLPGATRRLALYGALCVSMFAAIQGPRASSAELKAPSSGRSAAETRRSVGEALAGMPRAIPAQPQSSGPAGQHPAPGPAAHSGKTPAPAAQRGQHMAGPAGQRPALVPDAHSGSRPAPAAHSGEAAAARSGEAAASMLRLSLDKLATSAKRPDPAAAPLDAKKAGARAANAPGKKPASASVAPRSAAEALAAGDVDRAARLFGQLAAQSPDVPAYVAAARILNARRERATP